MNTFTQEITINADVSKVWSVLADVTAWAEWTASIESIEPLNKPPLGTGTQVRIRQPKLRPAVWVITEWAENLNFMWVTSNPGLRIEATHILKTTSDGCPITLGIRMEGFIAPLVKLLTGKLTEQYMAMEAEGLKKRYEQQ
ncbi:MAG: SRPBCC family protein [Candidatus Kapabacteria bacterium]|nr:SRPBCC family protein [Candidatus Kapabacteria bacterium]